MRKAYREAEQRMADQQRERAGCTMFIRHDHTNRSHPNPISLFAESLPVAAQANACVAAYRLANKLDEGIACFLKRSANGPMWVVFERGSSYGTFFVRETDDVTEAQYIEPDTVDIDRAIGELV
jgi:hypothetical protein